MDRKYEEEYSLLEIAKYNLKHWPILLICALLCGLVAGGYGYRNTEPSVVYYQELSQVSGDFYMSEFNGTSITERMYDLQALARTRGAYDQFVEDTGYELTFEEYKTLFNYGNSIVTSVVNIFMGYPLTCGDIHIESDEEAVTVMRQLMEAHEKIYEAYVGEGAIEIVGEPYTSTYTQAAADAASTPKDLLAATAKGGIAGVFLGLLIGIVVVSVVYLYGTVAKTAKEIEEKLKAPAVAFVHKNDKAEEYKKVMLFLEQSLAERETICYLPFDEAKAGGAYDLARAFARMNRKTLYVNLSAAAPKAATATSVAVGETPSLSDYLFGKCEAQAVCVTTSEDGVDQVSRNITAEDGKEFLSARGLSDYLNGQKEKYERIVVNAPDVMITTDAYGVAACCDKIVFACKRREVTGTDLYEIANTLENNALTVSGVVVYGN